jgi:hypothetical protein
MENLANEKSKIVILLNDMGMKELVPNLEYIRDRERSRVWNSKLYTSVGDANIEIIVYPFENEPGLVVDYEEEVATFHAFATMKDRWNRVPELILEKRTSEIGILITTSIDQAGVCREYLKGSTSGKNPPTTGIRCALTYHPQLDRILGGDYFIEEKGYFIKGIVLPVKRAQTMQVDMNELTKAYQSIYHLETEKMPFSVAVGISQIDSYAVLENGKQRQLSLEQIFTLADLRLAPSYYHELAIMLTLIPSFDTTEIKSPLTREDLFHLVRQLFQIIACGHLYLNAVFSRDAGCCLMPEFVTLKGGINDLYFFSLPRNGMSKNDIRQHKIVDLANAFMTIWKVSQGLVESLEPVFHQAISVYSGNRELPAELMNLLKDSTVDLQVEMYSRSKLKTQIHLLASAVVAYYNK